MKVPDEPRRSPSNDLASKARQQGREGRVTSQTDDADYVRLQRLQNAYHGARVTQVLTGVPGLGPSILTRNGSSYCASTATPTGEDRSGIKKDASAPVIHQAVNFLYGDDRFGQATTRRMTGAEDPAGFRVVQLHQVDERARGGGGRHLSGHSGKSGASVHRSAREKPAKKYHSSASGSRSGSRASAGEIDEPSH